MICSILELRWSSEQVAQIKCRWARLLIDVYEALDAIDSKRDFFHSRETRAMYLRAWMVRNDCISDDGVAGEVAKVAAWFLSAVPQDAGGDPCFADEDELLHAFRRCTVVDELLESKSARVVDQWDLRRLVDLIKSSVKAWSPDPDREAPALDRPDVR
jgi:hypothetical protein